MKTNSSHLLFSLLLILSFRGIMPVQAQVPTGFTSTTVSTGWNEVVGLTFTADGKNMFVWERPGYVWVVINGQRQQILDIHDEVGSWGDHGMLGFALHPQFASNGYFYLFYLVDRHHLLNFGTPAYNPATNDYNSATIGRVTRYTATLGAGGSYTVDPASRKILIGATKTTGVAATGASHVTGSLVFGTDGTLLIGTGDGASGADADAGSNSTTNYAQALADGIIRPQENVGAYRSQMINCLNGKILRIDPLTGAGIPSNPYYNAAAPNDPSSKVWTLGLRQPFRMSLKPGTGSTDPTAGNPGTLYIGDVGYFTWEEVDVVDRPRQNLGWPIFEGLEPNDQFTAKPTANQDAPNPLFNVNGCTQQYFGFHNLLKQATPTGTATFPNPCNSAQNITSVPTFVHTRPLIDWKHTATGPSRTGNFTNGTASVINIGDSGSPVAGPQFGGNAVMGGVFYPYNDFPAPYANTYFFGDYALGWIRSMTTDAADKPTAERDFGSNFVPVCMTVSPTETGLYFVNFPSDIRKITYGAAGTNLPPVAVATPAVSYGPSPLAVQFTGSTSSDPNGSALTYLWTFGDGTTSTAANPAHTFTTPTTAPTKFTVTLKVTDPQGLTNQTAVLVSVNNTPPQVTITSPAAGTRYSITSPSTYDLRATVTDTEHSSAQLSYAWQTILHHVNHEHPEPIDTQVQTTTTLQALGCGAETYYYRILLTVTDAGGLATTKEVQLQPDCATSPAPTFTLVNADATTNPDIQSLVDGATLNLATLVTRRLNIRANTSPATVGSVVFALTGTQTRNQTENVIPYALFSDNNGVYNPWTPAVGSYKLTATPYSAANGSGTAGAVGTINFTVIDQAAPGGSFTLTTSVSGSGTVVKSPDQATYVSGTSVTLTATPGAGQQFAGWSGAATGSTNPLTVLMNADKSITATFTAIAVGQQVSSYTLVNASTNTDIMALPAGTTTTLNLATLPTRNLNIRANTSPATVGSVIFAQSGTQTRNQTENVAPYALFSDNNGVYTSWTPAVGNYSLTARPYTGGSGSGTAGTALSISFSVIDQPVTGGPFTLTVNTMGSGTVARNPDQATYVSATSVVLTATPGAGQQFAGWSGAATGSTNPLTVLMNADKSITATFTAIAVGQQVTSFTLVNADINANSPGGDIQTLPPGVITTLNLATLSTRRLNIRANTSPATVGSVVFALSGTLVRNQTENVTPYALFSDNGGVYAPWTPLVGDYTLTARPYTGGGGAGTAGTALSISFRVIDQLARVAAGSAPAGVISAQAVAYPNPSATGRFALALPEAFAGAVSYRLVSALGATVATGTLGVAAGGAVMPLDFTAAMPATGLYYLLLASPQRTARLKLIRF